ncbi:hypothetical protein X798_02982 [Onchocerca flexuosa]|uniref:Uncharacterized protein n=1 Tax=Onchocerca flexuosa TaxID=387005 RepID=A0A238BY80_9BILA|nr:hypothetical protein X798_02982 [Onchocerca flexuosa]
MYGKERRKAGKKRTASCIMQGVAHGTTITAITIIQPPVPSHPSLYHLALPHHDGAVSQIDDIMTSQIYY